MFSYLGVENYPWIKDRSNDDDVASLGRILAEFSIFDKVAAVDYRLNRFDLTREPGLDLTIEN